MVTNEPPFRTARLYAALSGPFPPKAAIQAANGADASVDDLVRISADLAAVCDTAPGRWVMRSPDRQRHLRELREAGRLEEAIAWRRGLPDLDPATAELLAALEGSGDFATTSLQALLQPPQPSAEADIATLERLAGAIECVGGVAPGFLHLPGIRAAIDRHNQARRGGTLLQLGLIGREDDRDRIVDWIGNPASRTPVQALLVTGLPAIGKSTLLEAALQEAGRRRIECVVVRLDFDRQGLDLRDLAGLTSEVARQVAAQRPASAAALRLERLAASTAPSGRALKGTTAGMSVPEGLVAAIAQAVASQPGVVLFVLDTLEVLVSRGATQPAQLFAWLDSLLEQGLRPMSVVAAGRGDLRAALGDRRAGDPVMLDGLTPPESDRLLASLRVPPAARPAIQAQAGGSPLSLRLAAGLLSSASDAGVARPTRSVVAGAANDAQRYRALLSRFADPALKAILQPGLLVRRLNREMFAAVLIPAAARPAVDAAEASRLFDRLTAQDWLLQPMPGAPGWWRQTDLVRPLVFDLLNGTPGARRLHKRAAAWLRLRPETWAKADGLYHALFGNDGGKLPIDPQLALHFDERMLQELPPAPRERVRLARGDRSAFAESALPGAGAGAVVDRRAVTDMVRALDRGDPEEANLLHRRGFEHAHVDPAGHDGMAERRFFWRTGRWSEARQSLRWRDQAAAGPSAGPAFDETTLTDLEIRAEFEGERLARWFRDDPAAAGRVARMVHDAGKQRMGGAALILHLLAAGATLRMSEPDPSGDAFRLWTAPDGEAASRERRADVARRLCALSPYAEPIRWLIRFERAPGGLRQHAADSLAALRDKGWAEAPPSRRDPIDAFAEGGLLAEWLELASLALPHPDLSLVARRAARWRRTIAGRWSLGGRPRHWRGPDRVDAVIEARIARLCASPDPWRAARLEFDAWSVAAALPARITARAPGVVAAPRDGQAGSLDAALAAAATLPRLPAALIPAMAVAMTHPPSSPPFRIAGRHTRKQPMSSKQQNDESIERLAALMTPRRNEAVARAVSSGTPAFRALGMPPPTGEAGIAVRNVLRSLETGPHALEAGTPAVALEAIVRLVGRPPLIVRNGEVELHADLLRDLPAETASLIRDATAMVGSVGRIEFVNHATMTWGGTGWVIGQTREKDGRLVVTNRHVAALVATRAQDGRGVFARSAFSGARLGCSVDFNEEVDAPIASAREVRVTQVVYLAEDFAADVALLKIRTADAPWALPDPIPLAESEAERDELVALIGYPAHDSRNNATAMDRYFQGLYDVKRFAPGLITQTAAQGVIGHDCTSLGGNSGSPLISLRQRAAVGLHFAGVYGVGNSAVSVTTLKTLLRDPSAISVSGVLFSAARNEAPRDATRDAAELRNRSGFDPGFLDAALPATPWPTLTPDITAGLAKPSDATDQRPHELRYTNFGVMFSAAHKLPVVTAVNIDGAAAVRIKRGNDRWWFDGRIPLAVQHGASAYADRAIDRGHMVRREDPNWGIHAAQANEDTFHYTNSAPQHSQLNQGRALWLGLEEHILGSARTHGFKANVFTGPIFDDDDPLIEDGMRVPLEFWKVVVMASAQDRQALHATAYLLSQGHLIRKLMEDRRRSESREGFVFGAYRTFQITIAELERGTGYDFGALRTADPLARVVTDTEGVPQGAPAYLPLRSVTDMII